MKFSISRVAETFLAAAAVGLLAAVLIPWGDEAQKSAPEPSNAQVSVSTSNAHVQPNPASPVVILSNVRRKELLKGLGSCSGSSARRKKAR